jgi:O-antigen/teichoic acid export membrane protein
LINFKNHISPVKKNLSAGIITIIVRTLSVLFLIPFYIKYLGKDIYADWIILYSMPAIFELTNLGINKGVNNTFTFLYNNKKNNDANDILSQGMFMTFCISLISIFFLFSIWNVFNIYSFIGLNFIPITDSLFILCLLTFKIFSEMVRGILCSFFIAKNQSFKSTFLNLFVHVVEISAIIFLIYNGYSLLLVAISLLIISLTSIVALTIYNNINYGFIPNVRVNFKLKNDFLTPSIGFSIITVSRFIRDQGILIIIKNFFNSEALIIYNTTNTLVNYINALVGQIYGAISPVFNYYFSKKFYDQIKSLLVKSIFLTVSSSTIIGILIYIFRDLIWKTWLNNIIELNELLLILLIVSAILNSIWIIPKGLLEASNKHFRFSLFQLLISFIVIISIIILLTTRGIIITIIPSILIIYNLILIIYFFSRTKKILIA